MSPFRLVCTITIIVDVSSRMESTVYCVFLQDDGVFFFSALITWAGFGHHQFIM